MNHMKEVAEMLGVELEEEFKINDDSTYKFKLTNSGLFFLNYVGVWSSCDHKLTQLLNGKHEIIKLPKSILTEDEKEYLSNVIKPFRDNIICIRKCKVWDCARIYIDLNNYDTFYLPWFKKDKMYKNMEFEKQYSVEELGL